MARTQSSIKKNTNNLILNVSVGSMAYETKNTSTERKNATVSIHFARKVNKLVWLKFPQILLNKWSK